jgi:hypothetical protein
MATYVNDLRLKEITTGDESGTWGTSTNTNLELIAEAFSYGTEVITTNADTHTTTIADGATDPGRSLYLKYTGTLDSACTITIGPNTVSKVWIIENGTSGSQDIILSQGSGANITIPAGDTKVVYSDGAGAGAAFFDAFASLSVVDLKVQDDLTVTDAALVTGVLTTTATQVATGGITSGSDIISDTDSTDSLGSTGVRWLKGWFDTLTAGTLTVGSGSVTDSSGAISFGDENLTTTGIVTAAGTSVFTNLDISGDIDVDGTTNLDVVDIDGAVDMASTALVTGVLTANGGAVFNEGGVDADFRVESDNNANAFLVDASADQVRTDAVFVHDADGSNQPFYITRTGGLDQALKVTLDDNNVLLTSVQDEVSGANFIFYSTNATTSDLNMLQLDYSAGTVFNEDGVSYQDFRVESDTNANMLFVDAGNNRVGIGTASVPANRTLQVSSSDIVPIEATSSGGETIISLDNTATNGRNYFLISGGTSGTYAGGKFGIFDADAPADRMSIDSSGNVTFNEGGLDSDFRVESSTDAYALFVEGGSSEVMFGKSAIDVATVGVGIRGSTGETFSSISTGNTLHVYDTSAGTFRFYVGVNGGISNYSANNINLSDEREKKNIEDLPSQWDCLKHWDLKQFHYNADDDALPKKYGVIAQEIEAHCPEVIDVFKVDDDTERMGVKEQQMMWMAIKALQEAQTRIESLEARITTLES